MWTVGSPERHIPTVQQTGHGSEHSLEGDTHVAYTPAVVYPSRKIPGTHLCYSLSQPESHSAAGRVR